LYIDKTRKENDDYKLRYLCDDPNDPYGILEVLRTEKIKDFDPYKYLDEKILKTNLGIPDGIMAIKQSLIGTNWRRWLTDIESGQTLISTKSAMMRTNIKPRYGIMNLDNGELIKDVRYQAEAPRSYVHTTARDDAGKKKRYVFQKYMFALGDGRFDQNEYFYFLYLIDSITNRQSENYLKGKYYEGRDGDAFIQEMLRRGELVRI
jgi:hypothetical protein